ncbi:MAG: hypothetical protein V2A74_01855 [bacterium]
MRIPKSSTTNVLLTIIALLLAVIAFRPQMDVTTPAVAQPTADSSIRAVAGADVQGVAKALDSLADANSAGAGKIAGSLGDIAEALKEVATAIETAGAKK